jgi:hypothetical protein
MEVGGDAMRERGCVCDARSNFEKILKAKALARELTSLAELLREKYLKCQNRKTPVLNFTLLSVRNKLNFD